VALRSMLRAHNNRKIALTHGVWVLTARNALKERPVASVGEQKWIMCTEGYSVSFSSQAKYTDQSIDRPPFVGEICANSADRGVLRDHRGGSRLPLILVF
jgi:hypothetical protein